MERMYSISQVARMLGLGIDAVRFYEKKGLVHPQVNPQNRYRMYSLYQIMELLDVSYYRSLGMSIEQIQQLYESSNEEQLMELLDKKRQETEHRIRYSSCSRGLNTSGEWRPASENGTVRSASKCSPKATSCSSSRRTAWSATWSRFPAWITTIIFSVRWCGN